MYSPEQMTAPNSFSADFSVGRRRLRMQLNRCDTTTRCVAIMNLALCGIEAEFGSEHADTFRAVRNPDLRADYLLANSLFNDSDWHRKDDDVRWQWSGATWTTEGSPEGSRGGANQFGVPPKGNANFAWVQHYIQRFAPHGGLALLLANSVMSSGSGGEGNIQPSLCFCG